MPPPPPPAPSPRGKTKPPLTSTTSPVPYRDFVLASVSNLRSSHGADFESRCVSETQKLRSQYNKNKMATPSPSRETLLLLLPPAEENEEEQKVLGWQQADSSNIQQHPQTNLAIIPAIQIKKGPRQDQNHTHHNTAFSHHFLPKTTTRRQLTTTPTGYYMQSSPEEPPNKTTPRWNSSTRPLPPPRYTESLASYEARLTTKYSLL